MAHLETEAADTSAPVSVEEKAADFESYLFDDETDEVEGEEQDDSETDEVEEAEDVELDQDDEDSEPATAIEAPVSLNAEEKEVFAQLPPEAQQAWAASETRRNTQVQEATTKASNAQREAEARAAAADAEAKSLYARQLEEIGKAFVPNEPQREWYRDDTSYLIALRQHDQQVAQHNEFMQQVAGLQDEADTEAQQAFIAQRDRELMTIPEIANPETRKEYLDRAMSVASELGYDPGELAQGMQARDITALAKVAEYKAKAEKYDQAMSKQMQKVRAAKGKSLRPSAAPQDKSRAAKADQAWKRVKSGGSKAQQGEAFAEWLEASGHL